MRRYRFAYLGNFGPSFSTESHVSASIELAGHEVTRIQEGETRAVDIPDLVKGHDIFLHTQTYGLAVSGGTVEERLDMLARIKEMGVVTVGFHLDKWWGLGRADQLQFEPFFHVDHLFTADGGYQEEWAGLGINHHWLPPGVYSPECVPGRRRSEFAAEIAFVGSWQGHYHEESTHRHELVSFLMKHYRHRVKFWPRPGQHAIRGQLLNDLYASTAVVVGDSCRVDDRGMYWSDRCPETTGRGGFLLHPETRGLTDYHPSLVTWPAFDWERLVYLIDYYREKVTERETVRQACHEHTRAYNTYEVRVRQILEVLEQDGAL